MVLPFARKVNLPMCAARTAGDQAFGFVSEHNNERYSVNFSMRRQTNLRTGYERTVRVAPSGCQHPLTAGRAHGSGISCDGFCAAESPPRVHIHRSARLACGGPPRGLVGWSSAVSLLSPLA